MFGYFDGALTQFDHTFGDTGEFPPDCASDTSIYWRITAK
jgi:hypothetical protein